MILCKEVLMKIEEDLEEKKKLRIKLAKDLGEAASEQDLRENTGYDNAKSKIENINVEIEILEDYCSSYTSVECTKDWDKLGVGCYASAIIIEQGYSLSDLEKDIVIEKGEQVKDSCCIYLNGARIGAVLKFLVAGETDLYVKDGYLPSNNSLFIEHIWNKPKCTDNIGYPSFKVRGKEKGTIYLYSYDEPIVDDLLSRAI